MRRYSNFEKLLAILFLQIDMRSPFASEPFRDLRSNLETARADARSEGCVDIPRLGSEPRLHRLDRPPRNLGGRAAPTGVHRRDRATPLIHQQQRDAIGRLHGDYGAGRVFEQRIAFAQHAAAAFGRDAIGRMNLFYRRETIKLWRNI